MQPCPEALASGSVVIGDPGGSWVFDVVGTREASMHSGVVSMPADSVALGGFDPTDFEAGPCKADRWSEAEAETLDDLVDLGGFDPADFEAGAGPCEPGELACD